MKTNAFGVKVQVHKSTGKLFAAYFRFRTGKVSKTLEVLDGKAFADYSSSGKLLGIELIEPCSVESLSKIPPKSERGPIANFILKTGPRDLVLTSS